MTDPLREKLFNDLICVGDVPCVLHSPCWTCEKRLSVATGAAATALRAALERRIEIELTHPDTENEATITDVVKADEIETLLAEVDDAGGGV